MECDVSRLAYWVIIPGVGGSGFGWAVRRHHVSCIMTIVNRLDKQMILLDLICPVQCRGSSWARRNTVRTATVSRGLTGSSIRIGVL
jgi:hypothetical protein